MNRLLFAAATAVGLGVAVASPANAQTTAGSAVSLDDIQGGGTVEGNQPYARGAGRNNIGPGDVAAQNYNQWRYTNGRQQVFNGAAVGDPGYGVVDRGLYALRGVTGTRNSVGLDRLGLGRGYNQTYGLAQQRLDYSRDAHCAGQTAESMAEARRIFRESGGEVISNNCLNAELNQRSVSAQRGFMVGQGFQRDAAGLILRHVPTIPFFRR